MVVHFFEKSRFQPYSMASIPSALPSHVIVNSTESTRTKFCSGFSRGDDQVSKMKSCLLKLIYLILYRSTPHRDGCEQRSKGLPGEAMLSEVKAKAEEPPIALREVDRLTRNPEKLANAGGRCWKDT